MVFQNREGIGEPAHPASVTSWHPQKTVKGLLCECVPWFPRIDIAFSGVSLATDVDVLNLGTHRGGRVDHYHPPLSLLEQIANAIS